MIILYAILKFLIPVAIMLVCNYVFVPLMNKLGKRYKPRYDGNRPLENFETTNAVGISLFGDGFRVDPKNGSEVKYSFFTFIIPLIPVGCYRLKEVDNTSFGGGYIQESKTKLIIYGTERWRIIEILYLYLSFIIIGWGFYYFCLIIQAIIETYNLNIHF
jgi:hypothetical protein